MYNDRINKFPGLLAVLGFCACFYSSHTFGDKEERPEKNHSTPQDLTWKDLPNQPNIIPLQAIVKASENLNLKSLTDVAEVRPTVFGASIVTFRDPFEGIPLRQLDMATLQTVVDDQLSFTKTAIAEIRQLPGVEYAHTNGIFIQHKKDQYSDPASHFEADLYGVDRQSETNNESNTAKNKPGAPWYEQEINLQGAHAITQGSRLTRIAILDGGRSENSPHPDLVGAWVSDLEYDANSESRIYFPNESLDIRYHHGIAVAGVASRVCPSCDLLNVRTVSRGPGAQSPTLELVARAIEWSVNNGASIINMSFEHPTDSCNDSGLLQDALVHAENNGVVVVAAAGNTGQPTNIAPADCATVLSVAATREFGQLTSYSNRNSAVNGSKSGSTVAHVDLAAPGGGEPLGWQNAIGCTAGVYPEDLPVQDGILVPWRDTNGGQCRRYMAGTSFSAPHVAGLAGLIRSRNPSLTAAEVRDLVIQTTQTISCSAGSECGTGLIDAQAAVEAAIALPMHGDSFPDAQYAVNCSGLNCQFNALQSFDDQGIVSYQWLLPDSVVKQGAVVNHFVPGYGMYSGLLRVTDTAGQSSDRVINFNVSKYSNPSNFAPQFGTYTSSDMVGNEIDFYQNNQNHKMLVWSTFDTEGRSEWYLSENSTVSFGQWSAPLMRVTENGSNPIIEYVGTVSLDFSTTTEAWFSWAMDGISGGSRFSLTEPAGSMSGLYDLFGSSPAGLGVVVRKHGPTMSTRLLAYRRDPLATAKPIWMSGVTANSSNPVLTVQELIGKGLCPGCFGTSPPIPKPVFGAHSADLDLLLWNFSNSTIEFRYERSVGAGGAEIVVWSFAGFLGQLSGI